MALKLNIKTFGELDFDPNSYNTLVSDYDNDITGVNDAFIKNQEAMQVFKNAAGSPRLSEGTQGIVRSINEVVDLSVDYFDSVNDWSSGVSETVASVLGYGDLPSISYRVDRTVLDQIDENFQNGRIGIDNPSNAQNYISDIQEVLRICESALENIISDVASTAGSLPDSVKSSLTQSIESNNDAVRDTYNRINNYMIENIDAFTTQLQAAVDDMAQAASGSDV